jgi:O-6-methylguanine DNA methyltransferase
LNGQTTKRFPPLDLSRGSPFQQQVWKALQEIPFGSTVAYGEIGARVGKAMASRAIGNACGANPIPVLIPCHRVVAKGGRLGGFSLDSSGNGACSGIEGTLPSAEATLSV